MAYCKVVEDEGEDALELPLEDDDTLPLSTLTGQFANSIGLKYRATSGAFRALKLVDAKIHHPPEGWTDLTFVAVFPKVRPQLKVNKESMPSYLSALMVLEQNEMLGNREQRLTCFLLGDGLFISATHGTFGESYPGELTIIDRSTPTGTPVKCAASLLKMDVSLLMGSKAFQPDKKIATMNIANPQTLQSVFLFGFPGSSSPALPVGLKGRVVNPGFGSVQNEGFAFFTADFHCEKGFSGGPVVDVCGNLIGICIETVFPTGGIASTKCVLASVAIEKLLTIKGDHQERCSLQ